MSRLSPTEITRISYRVCCDINNAGASAMWATQQPVDPVVCCLRVRDACNMVADGEAECQNYDGDDNGDDDDHYDDTSAEQCASGTDAIIMMRIAVII